MQRPLFDAAMAAARILRLGSECVRKVGERTRSASPSALIQPIPALASPPTPCRHHEVCRSYLRKVCGWVEPRKHVSWLQGVQMLAKELHSESGGAIPNLQKPAVSCRLSHSLRRLGPGCLSSPASRIPPTISTPYFPPTHATRSRDRKPRSTSNNGVSLIA